MAIGAPAVIVLCLVVGRPWWWGAAVWLTALVLGAWAGRGLGRLQVVCMEFTRSEVRLVRPASTIVVDHATMLEIEVRHSGGPIADRRTTVRMTYQRPSVRTTVSVSNRYEPSLAGALEELLGSGVPIRESGPVQDL